MSSIKPRDRANFAELINAQLYALPIQIQENARVATTALRTLIDPIHRGLSEADRLEIARAAAEISARPPIIVGEHGRFDGAVQLAAGTGNFRGLSEADRLEIARAAAEISARPPIIPEDRFANDGEVINFLHENARDVPNAFSALPNLWRSNREVALEAICQDAHSYAWLPPALGEDKNFALEAIRANRDVFNELSEALQNDPDVRTTHREVSGLEPPENVFIDFSGPAH